LSESPERKIVSPGKSKRTIKKIVLPTYRKNHLEIDISESPNQSQKISRRVSNSSVTGDITNFDVETTATKQITGAQTMKFADKKYDIF
jgi:hypothetical protein